MLQSRGNDCHPGDLIRGAECANPDHMVGRAHSHGRLLRAVLDWDPIFGGAGRPELERRGDPPEDGYTCVTGVLPGEEALSRGPRKRVVIRNTS